MRTTLSIDDELLLAAKRRARERGVTLGELVNVALQVELSRSSDRLPRPAIPIFRGGGAVQPGVDLNSNRGLAELLDETLPLERRR